MAETFPISGSIDPKAFPFLLMDLHRQGATGSLKVDGPSYQKALYFRGGRILFGSSNDPRDQLGAILIESGKITPDQLEEVNAKVGSGNPLAKVLADSGFVSQRELGEAARAKVERILSDVIAYDSGSFEFEDGVLPKGAVDLKLSSERLVLAAVRRINDRNFVLRHLASLETVLAPTGSLTAALPEIHIEAAGLHEALDGRRTLKQAITHTRLDEFEGAKIACALMFLGLVTVAAPLLSAEPEPELDLGQTARMAFDDRPATLAMPSPSQPATVIMESSPLAERDSAAAAGSSDFMFMEPTQGFAVADAEPIVIDAEPAPEIEDAPTLIRREPEPALPRPAAPTPEPPRPRAVPAPVPSPLPDASEERRPPHPAPKRPSKDDLAALDALLNSRAAEGPLAPIEKPAQTWEPRFGQPSVRPPRRSGGGLRLPLIVAALLLVVAGGGAAWHYLGLGAPGANAVVSPPTGPAVTPPTRQPPVPSPESAATIEPSLEPEQVPPSMAPPATSDPPAAAQTPRPAVTAPRIVPSAGPAATPTTPMAAGTPTMATARTLLRQGRLSEAANGFVTNLRQTPAGSFSIQLLVACSSDTVEKALANVAAPDLYILPVNYKGRPCYRVCWGLFESEMRADSAVHALPEYFRKGGASPRVVPTSGLLP